MRKRLYSDRCWRTIAVSDRLVIFIYVHQGAKFKWNPTIKSGLLNNSLAPWRITLSKQAQLEAYSSREPGHPLPFHLMTAWVGNPQPAKPVPLEYLQGPFLCRRSWAPHHLLAVGWSEPSLPEESGKEPLSGSAASGLIDFSVPAKGFKQSEQRKQRPILRGVPGRGFLEASGWGWGC